MLVGNYESGYIDTNSVLSIINKINLYIENEEKIINDINNSLSLLSDYYSSDNSKVINDKVNNLYYALLVMLQNRKRYVDFIINILNSYIAQNEINFNTYNKL